VARSIAAQCRYRTPALLIRTGEREPRRLTQVGHRRGRIAFVLSEEPGVPCPACPGPRRPRRLAHLSAGRSTVNLRLAADAVVVPVEAVRVRVGHVPAHTEVAVGNVPAVEVRWRRRDADRRVGGRALPARRWRGRWRGLRTREAGEAEHGWSSIPFRASPVCPWRKSKKATPTTRALAQTRAALRAAAICLRRLAVAPVVQSEDGVSAIICASRCAGRDGGRDRPRSGRA
jgi:hypothetical protein